MNVLMIKDLGNGDFEEVEVAPEHTEAALSEGYEQALEMYDDLDEVQVVPGKHLDEARARGLKWDWERPQNQRQVKPPNMAESVAMGFANSATLGGADEIAGLSGKLFGDGYKEGKKNWNDQSEAAWQENTGSYAAGYLGSLAPAGLARGATTATKAAATGMGLGSASKYLGDDNATPDDVLKAGLTGGVMGGTAQALSNRYAPTATQKLEEFAGNRAAKVFDDSAKGQRIVERLPMSRAQFGQKLMQEGIVRPTQNVAKSTEKATGMLKPIGEKIGQIYDYVDTNIGTASIPTGKITRAIGKRLDELRRDPATAGIADKIESAYGRNFANFAEQNQFVSLKQLWELRKNLDEAAYTPTGFDKQIHKELQGIRKLMQQELEKSVSKVDPSLLSELQKLNGQYQIAATASKLGKDVVQRQDKNRSISLTDYLAGSAGAGVGALGGGPTAALGGILGVGANKLARGYGNQMMAGTSMTLAEYVKKHPEMLQYFITKSQQEGNRK